MFTLYDGERLNDMVESIKNNGVLTPIVVHPLSNGRYEILIGHNRWNASKIIGLDSIPAIIKHNLSEEEQEMYVIESNVMQRGFDNLKISEQARVVAMRYNKMFSQGKRNDIIEELKTIDNPNYLIKKSEESEDEHENPRLQSSRDKLGSEYNLSGKTISRLIRVDKLIDNLKELVDNGIIAFLAAVQISYLSENTQETVFLFLSEQYKIDINKAKQLRDSADKNGDVSDKTVEMILSEKTSLPKPKSVKISQECFTKYFEKGTKAEEITEIIEKALEAYFHHIS